MLLERAIKAAYDSDPLTTAQALAAFKARERFLPFVKHTAPEFEEAQHHRIIAEHLEAVAEGRIRRLMIFMPPRHGKSELASRRFPAWYLGRYPSRQVIAASYNSEFAADFGRDVRSIVASPEYGEIFPGIALAKDSKAADRWHITKNTGGIVRAGKSGIYVSKGIGGAMTGRGAHLFLIDDPIKDWEAADSEVMRQRQWNWFSSVARTRMMPGGAIVIILTRWHDDDLVGRILAGKNAGRWTVLQLPAIAGDKDPMGRAPGTALWPSWFPLTSETDPDNTLTAIREDMDPRHWLALYQQTPTPDDGTFFKRADIQWYDPAKTPPHLVIYGSSDYAVTDGKNDFTELGIWGVNPTNDAYLLDGWSGQTSSEVWVEQQLDLVDKYRPLIFFGESGVIQKSVEPFLVRRMRERQSYCKLEWLPSVVEKTARARGIQSRVGMRKVFLPLNEYGERVAAQLLSFPTGKLDDIVDMASLFGRGLDQMTKGSVPEAPLPPKDRWDDAFEAADGGTNHWKVL